MVQESVQSLLSLVEYELDSRTDRRSPSIYMAPGILRNLSPSSFSPRIVSIGPLHRDDENLKAFEGKKISCLANLLSRIDLPKEEILEACMQKVYASMKKIKACYVWPTKIYSDTEIAKMMVMDACFILEFICCRMEMEYEETESMKIVSDMKTESMETDSDMKTESDEAYCENMLSRAVYYDLVLLENQIPFFTLEQIYHCTLFKATPSISLNGLMIEVLKALKLLDMHTKKEINFYKTPSHILSLLHEYYNPQCHIESSRFPKNSFQSAVDLARAGVNIETNEHPIWDLKIEVKLNKLTSLFTSWSKHTLVIPKLYVHDFTEVILRNLIAYEQSNDSTGNYITSYAFAMDMLVNTQEDVTKLVKSNALTNDTGSDEEVANMINNLCKNVICEEFFYNQECIRLYEYCNSYWPKNIAWLRQNYFNGPWNFIALIAAVIVFTLTVVQTIFSIKSTK